MGRFIWLFGENLGATSNNNSYYMWRHVVERDDDIEKYFIMEDNKPNRKCYKSLPKAYRKFVVWRNTIKHLELFVKADMFFVSQSYRDIRPEQIGFKKLDLSMEKPIIYLQHGTLAMKVIGYTGVSYNNNFFNFLYYNKHIAPIFQEKHDFKPYQMYYGEFHPRYIELIKRFKEYKKENKRILWFMTWREYFGENFPTVIFMKKIKKVITDPKLLKYLDKTNTDLVLCVHKFFDDDKIKEMKGEIDNPHIVFEHASEIDVMDELARCDVLITDYSSVGFDVTLMNKPVVLFQPDMDEYLIKRELYCTVEELNEHNIKRPKDLLDTIINEKYGVNPFFRSRMPKTIDFDYILSGKHIDRIYDHYSTVQHHKVTFVGYNFYGIGGTVFATRSLAEALLERGYLVQLLSLKKSYKPRKMPYALNLAAFYDANRNSPLNLFKRHFYRRRKLFSYLKYDKDIVNLKPYAGYALTKWMNETNSETVISTRESLHLFLNDAASESIKNKIYFFHCPVEIFDTVFPDILPELNKCDIEKAVFVTESNRQLFIKHKNFTNYKSHLVLGNCLESSRSVPRDEILPIEEKPVYRGIYLLRVSEDRKPDIENLLSYGRYLRDNDIEGIIIDVYGAGDLVDEFVDTLVEEELTDYISYKGPTSDGPMEIRNHDAVVDFSLNHSFGMPYIEGVMNGKPVFCMENVGSREVMADIPDAYILSHEDLTKKLLSLPEIPVERLQENYDIITKIYSRPVLAENFLSYIGEESSLFDNDGAMS